MDPEFKILAIFSSWKSLQPHPPRLFRDFHVIWNLVRGRSADSIRSATNPLVILVVLRAEIKFRFFTFGELFLPEPFSLDVLSQAAENSPSWK